MMSFIKAYYKYMIFAVILFVWFLLLGPRMLSGSTEFLLAWFLGTVFIVVPGMGMFAYNEIRKVVKNNESNS